MPRFEVTELTTGCVQVVLSRELAGMLADVLDDQGRENRLRSPVYALGERLSRLVRPTTWFGPTRLRTRRAAPSA